MILNTASMLRLCGWCSTMTLSVLEYDHRIGHVPSEARVRREQLLHCQVPCSLSTIVAKGTSKTNWSCCSCCMWLTLLVVYIDNLLPLAFRCFRETHVVAMETHLLNEEQLTSAIKVVWGCRRPIWFQVGWRSQDFLCHALFGRHPRSVFPVMRCCSLHFAASFYGVP